MDQAEWAVLVDSKKILTSMILKAHFWNQDASRIKMVYLLSFCIEVQPNLLLFWFGVGEFIEQIWFTRIANIEELLYLWPFITVKNATWCQICSNLLTLCTQERKRLSGHFNKCISSSPVAVPGRLIQPTQKQTWGGDFQGYLTIQPQKDQLKLKIQDINAM